DQARREGAPVYVHCRAGKSRSVSVVIGWLIHEYKWPLKKAYEFVSERRKDVSPN
ncbi:DSPc-domain-containing protein, partial [Jaminaea rosea]